MRRSGRWLWLMDLISECSNLRCFMQIHAQLLTSNTLIDDNQAVCKAIAFFKASPHTQHHTHHFLNDLFPHTSSFPSNSLIATYADSTTPHTALSLYKHLLQHGFSPDMFTFPVILKTCVKAFRIAEGRQFHGVVIKSGFSFDLYVQNGFLHLYSSCGQWDDATKLFDEIPLRDVVTWTSFISGLVRASLFHQALIVFSNMDLEPNVSTLVTSLVACGRSGSHRMGMGIHGLGFKLQFDTSLIVGNALMDMYVKCTRLDEAKRVFHELPLRDAISWTCIISGLVQCEQPKEALDVFHSMQISGAKPDKVTLSSVLSACASLGAISYGKWVHEYVDSHNIEWDVHIGTSMLDMYAKCGSIEMALCIFHGMNHRNIFTWNALLGGLAMHGRGEEALDSFQQMLKLGVKPNEVTFLAVLTACCHNGLVDKAHQQFHHMVHVYNITPRIEHYGCMVDLLCRAGLLEEAWKVVNSMCMPPDVLIWGALLSACRACGDVEASRNILHHLHELEANDSGVYVLLSNTFASSDRWEDARNIRRYMKEKGVKKFPGSSVIEVDGKTHEFTVGDTKHPQQGDLHLVMNMLAKQVYMEGRL